MWKKILVAFVVLLIGLLGYAATLPDTFRVERSEQINAPPEVVFSILSDFRRGKDWAPWDKLDPNMKRTFSGPATGVGATYEWEGNDEVGKGRQEIVVAEPPHKIVTDLHFIEPFDARNKAEYLIEEQADGSRVTWSIYGPQPYISKLMCIFMDMDAIIGKDFETGLADLKRLAEKTAASAPTE